MKLIVTIDTEEDNWGDFNQNHYSAENIKEISKIQKIFDRFNIKPTYLITYQVANDNYSVDLLKEILDDGRCEIGTHCHPWNTPPLTENQNNVNSMLNNLPYELQYQKIKTLHNLITKRFGINPTSFRAGRWAFNVDTAKSLGRLGYKVDSSILAFQDWRAFHGPNYSDVPPTAFKIDYVSETGGIKEQPFYEVPATVGFVQKNWSVSNWIWKNLDIKFIRMLRAKGILDKLMLLNKIYLSPEGSKLVEMIKLTNTMKNKKIGLINMFFHSNTLKEGISPFTKTKMDVENFLERLEHYLSYTRDVGIESIMLSEVGINEINNSQNLNFYKMY